MSRVEAPPAGPSRVPATPLSPLIPDEIRRLLGKRPLTHGESEEDYDALFARVVAYVEPQDVVEWLSIKDIVDLAWEARRLRLMKAALINSGMPYASRKLVGPLLAKEGTYRR